MVAPARFGIRVRMHRHRPAAVMAVLIAITAVDGMAQPPMDGQTAGRRRDRAYVVRGIDDPDPADVAQALAADDGLLLQSGPRTTRKSFVAAVTRKARLALEHAGYAAAQATAAIETTPAGEEVVVTVVPGPRTMAAGIEITGLPADVAAGLKRWLKGERPPPGSVPQAFETDGGWSGTRWLDPTGQPARMESPLWNRDHPAPFDEPHLQAIRAAVARFFRDEGFFAAARLLDRRSQGSPGGPDAPAVSVAVRADPDGAVLTIDAVRLPPPSVLDVVELYAGARVTKDDLVRILGIAVGGPVTERDRLAWRETLRLSGRFIRHEVKFKESPPATPDGPPRITAIFDLTPYPPATPLAEEATREEQAALRVRTWLLETLADENDLVITWAPAADGAAAPRPPLGTLVVSTRQGVLLTALPGSPDAAGVAVSGGGIGWFLPQGAGWFEVPVPARERLAVDVAVSLSDSVDAGRHEYARGVSVGYGLEPRPRDADAAVKVTARIAPVACLALVHEGTPAVTWEGDTLVVAREEATVRIDSRTGRIESLRLPDGGTFTVDAAAGQLATDLEALRDAAGPDATRPAALVTSAAEFLAGEPLRASLARLLDAAGLAASLGAWKERLDVVADELARCAAAGAFSAADRAVADLLEHAAARAARPTLVIPAVAPADADAWASLTRRAAALAWRFTDCTCGGDAWPAALARLATFAAVGDSAALWELTGYMTDVRNGPVAQLAASAVAPTPEMAASFARQGLAKLAPEAFRHDCQPVLECVGRCGLDQAAVAILRGLDDEQARELGRSLLGDPAGALPLVHRLQSAPSDVVAVAAVPETLDIWWRESLRSIVEAALATRAAPAAEEPGASAP